MLMVSRPFDKRNDFINIKENLVRQKHCQPKLLYILARLLGHCLFDAFYSGFFVRYILKESPDEKRRVLGGDSARKKQLPSPPPRLILSKNHKKSRPQRRNKYETCFFGPFA